MKNSDTQKPTVFQRAVEKAICRIHAQLEKENTQATRPKSSSASPQAALTSIVRRPMNSTYGWIQVAATGEPIARSKTFNTSNINQKSSAVPDAERTVGDWLAELNKTADPGERTLFWREHYQKIIYARARENHPNALLLQRKH